MVSRHHVHQCRSRFKVDCSEQLNNRTCLCKNDTRHLITKISYASKGPSKDRQLHTHFVTNFIAADTQERQQQHSPTTNGSSLGSNREHCFLLQNSQQFLSPKQQLSVLSGVHEHSDKYAPRQFLGAQCAFKILMIHEVLQFVLRIAFRCVLHRCGSRDIHC